jgi:hypothetical protein
MKAYTTLTQDRIDLALDILHALLVTPLVWLLKLAVVAVLILAPVALGELLCNIFGA